MAYRRLRQNIAVGDGTTYTLCVGIVREKLTDGTPHIIEFVPMDEPIPIKDGMEFVTCYLPKCMMKSNRHPNAL